MPRPSDYSDTTAAEICERLSNGESLRKICISDEMPNKSTVFRWLESNETFRDQYARARECQADTLADEINDIADDSARDTIMVDGVARTDHDNIQRSRLRVDARKWVASKLKPKSYGEKWTGDLNVSGAVAIAVVPSGMSVEDWVSEYQAGKPRA